MLRAGAGAGEPGLCSPELREVPSAGDPPSHPPSREYPAQEAGKGGSRSPRPARSALGCGAWQLTLLAVLSFIL